MGAAAEPKKGKGAKSQARLEKRHEAKRNRDYVVWARKIILIAAALMPPARNDT